MTINSDQFQETGNGVWRDRATLLSGRGFLSGEAALMRAVYRRLSKAGVIYGNESDAAFDLRTEHQSYDR